MSKHSETLPTWVTSRERARELALRAADKADAANRAERQLERDQLAREAQTNALASLALAVAYGRNN